MDLEKLRKANELNEDIQTMEGVIREAKSERHWIRVITPAHKDAYYSVRFQNELVEWLKRKVSEYQKELDSL